MNHSFLIIHVVKNKVPNNLIFIFNFIFLADITQVNLLLLGYNSGVYLNV